jgi:membrane protein
MTRLELKILKWTPVRAILNSFRNVYLPGFEGLSLYEAGRRFFKEMKQSRLNERSAAVTYNFVMAIPPTLLFLFSLVPYLPLKDVQNTILTTLLLVTPNERIYNNVSEIIVDFMNKERGGILSFGLLLTLFFSSNGMMGLMRSFDRSVPVYVKRSKLKRRWTAIKLTFILIGVALLSLVVLIMQTSAVNGLLLKVFNSVYAVKIFSLATIILIIFFTISIIYTYGPSLSRRFHFISPGSVFATVMNVLTTTVFFFLVNNFLNYNKIYGPIGTLIAFMVWMWLNTLVILIGYELNIIILMNRAVQPGEKEEEQLK